MRLGIDLDGVCYKFVDTYAYLMRSRRGVDLPPGVEWWDSWDADREWTQKQDRAWLWSDGVKYHGLFRHGHMYSGTIESLRQLEALGHEIVVITKRPRSAVRDTLAWLAFHEVPASEVHVLGSGSTKTSVVCDMYLDDSPENIEDLSQGLPEAIPVLFQRPWNAEWLASHPNRCSVGSWPEFVELVKEYSKVLSNA